MTVTIQQHTETLTITKPDDHDGTPRLASTGDLDTLTAGTRRPTLPEAQRKHRTNHRLERN